MSAWDGRVVPSGLHGDSDEFTTGALDASWLDVDHGNWITHTVESPPDRLVSTGVTNATFRYGGRYKAIPSAEFQFYSVCGWDCHPAGVTNASGIAAGIAVFQDATNVNGDMLSIALVDNNPQFLGNLRTIIQRLQARYDDTGSAVTRSYFDNVVWLRMRVVVVGGSTTTVTCDWSSDGVQWATMSGGSVSLSYPALHYGIWCNCNTAAGTVMRTIHQHFRVLSGAGASAHNYALNGGYL